MRFDAQRGTVERWALTDIGDRAVAARLAFEARASDVDAASGKQLLLRGEGQRGKGEAQSCPSADDHFAREPEGPTQKTRGVGHVCLGNITATRRPANACSLIDHA